MFMKAKKYSVMSLLIICLLVITSFTGCGGSGQTGGSSGSNGDATVMEPVNLRFAHFFAATHPVETVLAKAWREAVEEATGGLVTITTYPGQTLTSAVDTYVAIERGLADMGLSVFTYSPGRFPVVESLELPGLFYETSAAASHVARDLIFGMQPEEIKDTKLMLVYAQGPSHLVTKVPVRNLDDLQKLEIRTFGTTVQTFEALGAVPVSMAQGDTYEALSRGIVQGTCASLMVLKDFRQAEVSQYITYTPFLSNAVFFVTMNLDVWNSFPPDIQEAIERANVQVFDEVIYNLWDFLNEDGLHYGIDNYGHEEFFLSDEETGRWLELIYPLQDQYVADMEAKGLPGRQIMDEIQRLSAIYNERYPYNR
jgi:TRAP-type C4-dicarboxylate transport system substrate-binding protein